MAGSLEHSSTHSCSTGRRKFLDLVKNCETANMLRRTAAERP
jgi:hypothetical protein